jgi:hypothetical protein
MAMEVENQTPSRVRLLQLERGAEEVQAVLVVKSTLEWGPHMRWVYAQEQVPIVNDRLDTQFGIFHGDSFVFKEGVDLCVLGTVQLRRSERLAHLELSVGSHTSNLLVFGDRHWTRSGFRLRPSDPAPFSELPLAYSRAYGGSTEHDYETSVYQDNPIGLGYYLSPEKAVGHPLPNIELATGPLIAEWSDQPSPGGWAPYPQFWGIRAREGMDVPSDEHTLLPRLKPRLNNNAHPSLVLNSLSPGTVIRVRGMRPDDLVFSVPRMIQRLEIQVGDQTTEAAGHLDGVFFWADHGRLTLTHRFHFSYRFRRGERRRVRLAESMPMEV